MPWKLLVFQSPWAMERRRRYGVKWLPSEKPAMIHRAESVVDPAHGRPAILVLVGRYGLSTSWPDLFRPSPQHGAAMDGRNKHAPGRLTRGSGHDDVATRWAKMRIADGRPAPGRAVLRRSAPNVPPVLGKLCRIDPHPRVFGPRRVAVRPVGELPRLRYQPDALPICNLIFSATFAGAFVASATRAAAGSGDKIA
jgi:hypothetical protein